MFVPIKETLISVSALISDVVHLERVELASLGPLDQVDAVNLRTLRHWVSSRFVRAAFPSAFNLRLKAREKKIRNALEKATAIDAIYLILAEEGELPSQDPYTVFVTATMIVEKYADSEVRGAAQTALLKFAAEMAKCDGIKMGDDPKLLSESEFTLDDMRNSQRWDCDSMSLKEGVEGETPPA